MVSIFALLILQIGLLITNSIFYKLPVSNLKVDGYLVGSIFLVNSESKLIKTETYAARSKRITIKATDYSEKTNPEKIGFQFDSARINNRVLSYGRNGGFLHRIYEQDLAFLGLANIVVNPTSVNQQTLGNYLTYLETKITGKPQNASFAYQNNKLIVLADKEGFAIDEQKALSNLDGLDILSKKSLKFQPKTLIPN